MSPSLFNKCISVYQRETTRTDGGGFTRSLEPLFRDIRARIQPMRPGAMFMQFGSEQVPVTHSIYTVTDVSAAVKEDLVTDQDDVNYVILSVTDESGIGRLWRINCKLK